MLLQSVCICVFAYLCHVEAANEKEMLLRVMFFPKDQKFEDW